MLAASAPAVQALGEPVVQQAREVGPRCRTLQLLDAWQRQGSAPLT